MYVEEARRKKRWAARPRDTLSVEQAKVGRRRQLPSSSLKSESGTCVASAALFHRRKDYERILKSKKIRACKVYRNSTFVEKSRLFSNPCTTCVAVLVLSSTDKCSSSSHGYASISLQNAAFVWSISINALLMWPLMDDLHSSLSTWSPAAGRRILGRFSQVL